MVGGGLDLHVPTVVDTHYICILFILPVDLDLPVRYELVDPHVIIDLHPGHLSRRRS